MKTEIVLTLIVTGIAFGTSYALAWALMPPIPDNYWSTFSGGCLTLILVCTGCLFGIWKAYDERKNGEERDDETP